MTSQLNLDDKVTKIQKIILEKNMNLQRYTIEILNKTFTDAIGTILMFVINLELIDKSKFINFAEKVNENGTQSKRQLTEGKPLNLLDSIISLKILESFNLYLKDLNEGQINNSL